MLKYELKEAIDAIEKAYKQNRFAVSLTPHRMEQINRILKYVAEHWESYEQIGDWYHEKQTKAKAAHQPID